MVVVGAAVVAVVGAAVVAVVGAADDPVPPLAVVEVVLLGRFSGWGPTIWSGELRIAQIVGTLPS